MAAIEQLAAESIAWRDRLSLVEMDVTSDASVAAAAEKLRADNVKLYALCNNAGTATESMSTLFEVNCRGPRRVVEALLPLLEEDGGRIVNISSGTGPMCVAKTTDAERRALLIGKGATWDSLEALMQDCEALPQGAGELESAMGIGTSLGAYGLSKAVLNAYTAALARDHPKLRVNACSPGMINTDLLKDAAPWWVPGFVVALLAPHVVNARPAHEATAAPDFLLFGEIDKQVNGAYYGSDALRSPLDAYRKPGSPPYVEEQAGP